jgi:uncharacterized protein
VTGLAVFAKYPEPGKVKTRLAKSIGPEAASAVYERLLGHFIEHTLHETSRQGVNVTWFCDPGTPLEKCRELFSFTGFSVELQRGADLGARMKDALARLLERHDRALVVGTDCIDLSAEGIVQAAAELSFHDLSLGPTGDGGYYLLGVEKVRNELFDDIPWSTAQVLPLTLERAESLGLKTKLLQPLRDVDNLEDWKAIGWRCDEESDAIRSLRRKRT